MALLRLLWLQERTDTRLTWSAISAEIEGLKRFLRISLQENAFRWLIQSQAKRLAVTSISESESDNRHPYMSNTVIRVELTVYECGGSQEHLTLYQRIKE
jgi:hypothetical protein